MYNKNLFKGFHPNPNGTESIVVHGETIRGNWVTGGCLEHEKRAVCFAEDRQDDDFCHLIIMSGFADWNMPRPLTALEVVPETVSQFTGLTAYWDDEKTSFEAEVWEHDLLEVDYEGKRVICKVEYESGMFILTADDFADSYIPLFDVVVLEDEGWVRAKKVGNAFASYNC